ncbi:hypothetical protein AB0H71_12430 [Nocardia sp. NPDC050697]|uniref:hypothetical protein n=1 Tax=Nocardia sp. NPDC050697 TaxID=3155158 RepID=UPI0033DBB57E
MDEGTNRQLIQDHFATLKFGAESVGAAGTTIAAPISDYQAATIDLGAKTTSEINKLELSIAVTALVGGALALFSLGTSAAGAAAAISADVALTVNAIQASYRTTQMVRVIGLASLAAGAVGAVDAFHAVPEVDLDRAITGLAALIAIKVFADDDGALTVATKYEDLNPAPEVPLGGLTDASETYVRGKHVEGGANVTPKKSVFDGSEDLDELVERAQDTEARGPNDYGNYERDVDAGREIGTTSQEAGARPTTRYKVITDRWGTVVNMYPI